MDALNGVGAVSVACVTLAIFDERQEQVAQLRKIRLFRCESSLQEVEEIDGVRPEVLLFCQRLCHVWVELFACSVFARMSFFCVLVKNALVLPRLRPLYRESER